MQPGLERARARIARIAFVRLPLAAVILAGLVALARAQPPDKDVNQDIAGVLGTWTGKSVCVGDRPACKNEVVVYRFLAIEGKPDRVTLLADKIIEQKRVPMGKLEFVYAKAEQKLTCEFTGGRTHGLWAFTVSGDTMTGTLVVLPDKLLARFVSVHRVSDDQVPKAPPLDEY